MAITIPDFGADSANGAVDKKTKSTLSAASIRLTKIAQLNEEDECEVIEIQKISQSMNINAEEECAVANVGGIACTVRLVGDERTPENAVLLFDALRDKMKDSFTAPSGGGNTAPAPTP